MAAKPDIDKLQEKLARIDEERTAAKGQLDRERLARVTSDVVDTITSAAFVEKMAAARQEAEEGAGLDVAADLLSIDALRSAGVKIPDDFRMTSRVFEDRVTGTRLQVNDALDPSGMRPLGWGACAGGGGLTFCGCGGFSTLTEEIAE